MTPNKIVLGGERVGKSPVSGPAFRANEIRQRSVTRRFGRRPARFIHAVDWGYAGFVLAWTATALVALHVAMGGGLR